MINRQELICACISAAILTGFIMTEYQLWKNQTENGVINTSKLVVWKKLFFSIFDCYHFCEQEQNLNFFVSYCFGAFIAGNAI